MKQVILMNGRAVMNMADYVPGNGIIFEGFYNINDIVGVTFTKNIIDNPAVEKLLRERYGFGDNLPRVQVRYDSKNEKMTKELHASIEGGDVIYSIVDSNSEKIHQGKLSGEAPIDLKIQVLKYIGI